MQKLFELFLFFLVFSNMAAVHSKDIVVVFNEHNLWLKTVVFSAISATTNLKLKEVREEDVQIANTNDSATTDERICLHLLSNSIHPILLLDIRVSTLDMPSLRIIKNYFQKRGLPVISIGNKEDGNWRRMKWHEQRTPNLINALWPSDVISNVVIDIALHYKFRTVSILFDASFPEMDTKYELFKDSNIRFMVRRLNGNFSALLEHLKKSEAYHFFVVGTIHTLNAILESAASLEMLDGEYDWYLVTKSLDQLKCFHCEQASITFLQPFKSSENKHENYQNLNLKGDNVLDYFFVKGLLRMTLEVMDNMNISSLMQTDRNCSRKIIEAVQPTIELADALRAKQMTAKFGEFVFRPDFAYQSIALQINRIDYWNRKMDETSKGGYRLEKIGKWVPDYPRGRFFFISQSYEAARKMRYQIVTIIRPPFMMKYSNGTFYGYLVDLLHKIQEKLNNEWDYEIREAVDGFVGEKNPKNGLWDGVIGELQRKKATIGLAPISVMAERASVVDFTVPFYDMVGFTILIKRPPITTHLFRFITVLEEDVWFAILAAYICTSVLLFIFDRLSPYSHTNTARMRQLSERCRQFNLKECFWFCMTSLTPQGGGEAPKNVSSRLLAANWWLFAFIVTTTYTANLAAFLTHSNLDSDIDSLYTLHRQYRINFSVIRRTIAYSYFERRAKIEDLWYEKWKEIAFKESVNRDQRSLLSAWVYPFNRKYTNIWIRMRNTGFEESYEGALRRVMNSDYALIAEAAYNRYTELTNCDVVEVGSEFSRKPLALIVMKNSTIKEKLDYAILKLLNERTLEALKDKWWRDIKEQKSCPQFSNDNNSEGIGIASIGGVFVIIFVGIIFMIFTLIIEYCLLQRNKRRVTDLQIPHPNTRKLFKSQECEILPVIGTPIIYRAPFEVRLNNEVRPVLLPVIASSVTRVNRKTEPNQRQIRHTF